MSTQEIADKIELTELTNKLFMYTDAQQWKRLLSEVFCHEVGLIWEMDKPKIYMQPKFAKCGGRAFWVLMRFITRQGIADIYAYAIATHYKKSATKGNTRTYTGSHDLKAIRTDDKGWRLSQFKYNLKYIDGNASLE